METLFQNFVPRCRQKFMGLRYVDRIPRKARVRATRTLFDFPCFPLRASLCLPLLWNFHSEVWLARV